MLNGRSMIHTLLCVRLTIAKVRGTNDHKEDVHMIRWPQQCLLAFWGHRQSLIRYPFSWSLTWVIHTQPLWKRLM